VCKSSSNSSKLQLLASGDNNVSVVRGVVDYKLTDYTDIHRKLIVGLVLK
jgi:hypothetical protein